MYALILAQSRGAIHSHSLDWSRIVKPGAHIQQAIITEEFQDRESCSFPGCSGKLSDSRVERDVFEKTWYYSSYMQNPVD